MEDNIRKDAMEMGGRHEGCCEHVNERSGSIKGGEFLD